MSNPVTKFNKRKSGCTLTAENVYSLATHWGELFNRNVLVSFVALARAADNEGHKNLIKHDPELLRMLKTWQQSTRLVSEAIDARVAEIKMLQEEIAELATKEGLTPMQYVEKHLGVPSVVVGVVDAGSNDTPPEAA